MPNDIEDKLNNISTSFNELIDLIREDLHLNNNFIHDFIEEYK